MNDHSFGLGDRGRSSSPGARMTPLATIDATIEVEPSDWYLHWRDETSGWERIEDHSTFQFRVAGRLLYRESLFGLYGPVILGPERYQNLIANVLVRGYESDWTISSQCWANCIVCPTIAERDPCFPAEGKHGLKFHQHPEGMTVTGYPRTTCIGNVRIVETPQNEDD